MKNITLSVEDEVLFAVRRYAAAHNCSVNALVRAHLTNIAAREDRAQKARQKIRKLSEQSKAKIGTQKWSRSDLHER